MKILVAEDDRKTAAYLRTGLTESGFVVDVAENGSDGLCLATTRTYDLIVLDIRLPRQNGWDVLTSLRCAGRKTPVLILTAYDSVPDRVKGLELGADDYLIKPFAFSELRARVHSILRRGPGRQAETLNIADLTIDLVQNKVMRGGRRIHLTAKEFGLLSLLARHEGEILPRTMIAEQVWDMNFDCDTNVVDVAVRRLRSKIDDSFERKLIYSVRGMGYVLEER